MLKVQRAVYLRTGKETKWDSGVLVISYANNIGESDCEKVSELYTEKGTNHT